MMDIAKLQTQTYLDTLRAYEKRHGKTIAEMDAELEARLASQAGAASTPDEAVEREPGDRLREATEFADALGKLRRGHAGQALDHVCRVEVIKDGHFKVTLPGGE